MPDDAHETDLCSGASDLLRAAENAAFALREKDDAQLDGNGGGGLTANGTAAPGGGANGDGDGADRSRSASASASRDGLGNDDTPNTEAMRPSYCEVAHGNDANGGGGDAFSDDEEDDDDMDEEDEDDDDLDDIDDDTDDDKRNDFGPDKKMKNRSTNASSAPPTEAARRAAASQRHPIIEPSKRSPARSTLPGAPVSQTGRSAAVRAQPAPQHHHQKNSGDKNHHQQQQLGKDLEYEDLAKFFHLPITAAAVQLGVCVTVLKKRCRRHGVRRWPHRKLKSLDKLKEKLEREEAVSTDKQYYQAEIHSIVQKKDLLFRAAGPPKHAAPAPNRASSSPAVPSISEQPVLPSQSMRAPSEAAPNPAEYPDMQQAGTGHRDEAQRQVDTRRPHTHASAPTQVQPQNLPQYCQPHPVVQSPMLGQSPMVGQPPMVGQSPVLVHPSDLQSRGHPYTPSHADFQAQMHGQAQHAQAFAQARTNSHGQSPALSHHPPSHSPHLNPQPVFYCGIYNCDCYMTGGVSTHGYHAPLAPPGGRPPMGHYYAAAGQQSHFPAYQYPYQPYHISHPHSMVQVNVLEPTTDGSPQALVPVPVASASAGTPTLQGPCRGALLTGAAPSPTSSPLLADKGQASTARSGSTTGAPSPDLTRPELNDSQGCPTNGVSLNGQSADRFGSSSVVQAGIQPNAYPYNSMPVKAMPQAQPPHSYPYEHATVLHPYWAEMSNSSLNPSNLVTLYNQTTHHHHHHAPAEVTSQALNSAANNRTSATPIVQDTSSVMAAPNSVQNDNTVAGIHDAGTACVARGCRGTNQNAPKRNEGPFEGSVAKASAKSHRSRNGLRTASSAATTEANAPNSNPAVANHHMLRATGKKNEEKRVPRRGSSTSGLQSEAVDRAASDSGFLATSDKAVRALVSPDTALPATERGRHTDDKKQLPVAYNSSKRPRIGNRDSYEDKSGEMEGREETQCDTNSRPDEQSNSQTPRTVGTSPSLDSNPGKPASNPGIEGDHRIVRGSVSPSAVEPADNASALPSSRSDPCSSAGRGFAAQTCSEGGPKRKLESVVKGSSDSLNIPTSAAAPSASGATGHGGVASLAKRYDHTVHQCSTLRTSIWAVDSSLKVTSAIGPKLMLGFAGIPSLGKSILDGTETSVESKRTIRDRYALVRKGERIERILRGPGGQRYLYILAPLRSRAGADTIGVSGMLVELSGNTLLS